MTSRLPTVLFLNAGRRVELLLAFRAALETVGLPGRLLASDVQGLAPALYEADHSCLLPHSSSAKFLPALREVCVREEVDLVVPLIDPDLPVLAKHRQAVESTGTRILLSSGQAVSICGDKRATSAFLGQNGFPAPKVLAAREVAETDFPLLIKPRDGSASANVFKAADREELAFFLEYVPNAIIQEFVAGQEYTVDVFCDWSSRPLIAVPRERIKVRAGEVSVGRVRRQNVMEELAMAVAATLGAVGPINVQMIDGDGGSRVIEINPRYGGGCRLSMAAGAPMAEWTLLMALGRDPAERAANLREGLTMMRYDQSLFIDDDEIRR
jgi:carbamoyl-phosphate synthase large subunit